MKWRYFYIKTFYLYLHVFCNLFIFDNYEDNSIVFLYACLLLL